MLMKALEFWAHVNPDHTLAVPPEVAVHIQPEQPVRVILLIPELDEDKEWTCLAAEQFLKGYAESDAIYDELSVG